jgi:uncharacterized protein (TIGR03437 family)
MTRLLDISSLLIAAVVAARAQPAIVSVVNAASFQTGLPYGGALATVFVSGLSGLTPGTYIAPSSQALPYSLGGVQVTVNGAFAPILAVSVPSSPSASTQVNFQVPLERNVSLAPGTPYPSFSVNGVTLASSQLGLVGLTVWGGFFSGANAYAVALHASDSSPVTQQSPAHPGETIIAYADDFFTTWPPPPIGTLVTQPGLFQLGEPGFPRNSGNLFLQTYPAIVGVCPGSSCLTPNGSVTDTPALQVTYQGLASGAVGVEEIHFKVPENQQAGDWPLFFNVGSCPDGSGVPGTCGAAPPAESSPYVLLPVDSTLADSTGAALSAAAAPFQVLPTDIEVTGEPLSPASRMFPPPDARMIHVYATGLR